jgi:hypothetical protein
MELRCFFGHWLELDDPSLGLASCSLFFRHTHRHLFAYLLLCLSSPLPLSSFFPYLPFSYLSFILYALRLRLISITTTTPTTTTTAATTIIFFILVTMSSATLIPHLRQASKQALPKISSLPSTLLTRTASPILISKRALASTTSKTLSTIPGINPLRQYSTPSLAIHNEKTNVNQGNLERPCSCCLKE